MRLDALIAANGLARSRSAAQQLIKAGRVSVRGQVVTRSSQDVTDADEIVVDSDPWVSRAAHKLIGVLDHFAIEVPSVVLDAGASTGGFTQVCLVRGATRVHAIDVGHGQLDAALRRDPRVVVTEGFNLRDLTPDTLPEPVELVVTDVSFISLSLLVPQLLSVLAPGGQALLLVKPQFEVGKGGLDDRGVVKDSHAAQAAVQSIADQIAELGWQVSDPVASVITGESGNQEFWLRCDQPSIEEGA